MNLLTKISLITFSLSLALSSNAQTLALKNINVVDVVELKVNHNKTVFIEKDKIIAITDTNDELQIDGAIAIDMSEKFLIPGLIDTHVHHATSPDDSDNDQITRMRLRKLLQGGVTSVRDMGGDTRVLSSLKRRADNDIIQAPDIFYSVIIGGKAFFSDPRTVASAKGETPGQVNWMRAVDEQTDFDDIMLRAAGTGATGIKIYAKVPAHLIPRLQFAAKKHGLKVWSHAFVGPAKPQKLVNAGVETISHAPDLSAHVVDNFYQLRRKGESISNEQKIQSFELGKYQDLIADMKSKGTILDPTLTVFEKQQQARGEQGKLMYDWGKIFTKLAFDSGIDISTGTDGASDYYQSQHPLVHHEMELLVKDVGMSPLLAIQAATINGAKVIGIEESHGDINVGKVANLVVLNQDPSESLEHLKDIAHVIKNGQFIYLGDDKSLPFVSAKKAGGMLWLSGQIGNFPSTKTLAGGDIASQMQQAMRNIGSILQAHDLNYQDIAKCTLMLASIDDWQKANTAYLPFFNTPPARSAYAAAGLALDAKVEVECIAEL